MSDLDELVALLRDATAVAALTGAGISTDSGIPDFRGPNGTWTLDPTAERLTHWPTYRDDEQVRRRSWRWRVANPALRASPNDAHRALARLAEAGRLVGLATQNVDGLHVAAGTPPALVQELHGSMRRVVCTRCDWSADMGWAVARVEDDGDDDPRCPECGAITKAATVFFGEVLPEEALGAAVAAATACDLYLAVGSSLTVHPAAGLPRLATEHDAPLVVVNAEPTPLDGIASLVVRTPIGEVLPQAVDAALRP